MTLLSYTYDIQPGTPEDVTQVMANFNSVKTIINGLIDDANIAPAAAIAITKLLGYPADNTKFLRGDGTWQVPGAAGASMFAHDKTTLKTISNSAALTDLLNGEITIPANELGANGFVLFFLGCDIQNNSGIDGYIAELSLKFGATSICGGGGAILDSMQPGVRGLGIFGCLANVGSISSQVGVMLALLTGVGGLTYGNGGSGETDAHTHAYVGTSAEATSSNKAFQVMFKWPAANANAIVNMRKAIIRSFKVS